MKIESSNLINLNPIGYKPNINRKEQNISFGMAKRTKVALVATVVTVTTVTTARPEIMQIMGHLAAAARILRSMGPITLAEIEMMLGLSIGGVTLLGGVGLFLRSLCRKAPVRGKGMLQEVAGEFLDIARKR